MDLAWAGMASGRSPACIREVRPAWSDENLRSLASQVRSGLFFAHVRASTGTATTRANCHPFSAGGMMFMHNGQVGEWTRIRRRVEAMIPDDFYDERTGTTDSEAIFLAALSRGLVADPVRAITATLGDIRAAMDACRDCLTAALHGCADGWRAAMGVPLGLRRAARHAVLAPGCGWIRGRVRTDRRRRRAAGPRFRPASRWCPTLPEP